MHVDLRDLLNAQALCPGYGRWLPKDGSATELRKASAALNANAHGWSADVPFEKTTEWYRKHAKRGDRALMDGMLQDGPMHSSDHNQQVMTS